MTEEQIQLQAKAASRRDVLLRESVARIRIEDGIDEGEAQQIARLYFQQNSPTQGAVSLITSKGNYWEISIVESNTASAVQPILVDKTTGGVIWALGPATRTVQELLAR